MIVDSPADPYGVDFPTSVTNALEENCPRQEDEVAIYHCLLNQERHLKGCDVTHL
jgi:hypothetical protein